MASASSAPSASKCPTCSKVIPTASFLLHTVHCSRRVFAPVSRPPLPPTSLSSPPPRPALTACLYCDLPLSLANLVNHEAACGARTTPCPVCAAYVRLSDMDAHMDAHRDADSDADSDTHRDAVSLQQDRRRQEEQEPLAVVDSVLTAMGIDTELVDPPVRKVLAGVFDDPQGGEPAALALIEDTVSLLVHARSRGFANAGTMAVQLAMWTRYSPPDSALTATARSLLRSLCKALPAAHEVSHLHAPGLVAFPPSMGHVMLDVVLPLALDRALCAADAPSLDRHLAYMLAPEDQPASSIPSDVSFAVDVWGNPTGIVSRAGLCSLQHLALVVLSTSSPRVHDELGLTAAHACTLATAVADLDFVTTAVVPLLGPRHPPGSLLDVDRLVCVLGPLCAYPHKDLSTAATELLAAVLAAYPSYAARFMTAWLAAVPPSVETLTPADVAADTLAARARVARAMAAVRLASLLLWANPHLLRTHSALLSMVRSTEAVLAAVMGSRWEATARDALDSLLRGVPAFLYAKDAPFLSGCGDVADILALDSPAALDVVQSRVLTATGAADASPRYGSFHTSLVVLYLMARLLDAKQFPAASDVAVELAVWTAGLLDPRIHQAPPVWLVCARPLVSRVLDSLMALTSFEARATELELNFIAQAQARGGSSSSSSSSGSRVTTMGP